MGVLHGQFLIGLVVSLVNISIHAVIMARVSRAARWAADIALHKNVSRLVLVMMAAVTVLMAAHIIEIGCWAIVYAALDVTPHSEHAFYFAFVNYTTLGYGDMLPREYWRILGPMTAMNGIMLFGWSTAVIYDVLRTVAQAIPMGTKMGTKMGAKTGAKRRKRKTS
jgi:polyferredoxin